VPGEQRSRKARLVSSSSCADSSLACSVAACCCGGRAGVVLTDSGLAPRKRPPVRERESSRVRSRVLVQAPEGRKRAVRARK
jgi:hypothetical protein